EGIIGYRQQSTIDGVDQYFAIVDVHRHAERSKEGRRHLKAGVSVIKAGDVSRLNSKKLQVIFGGADSVEPWCDVHGVKAEGLFFPLQRGITLGIKGCEILKIEDPLIGSQLSRGNRERETAEKETEQETHSQTPFLLTCIDLA